MFCPQCGTAHTPGGRFCGNCGLLLPFAALAGAMPDVAGPRTESPLFVAATQPSRTAPTSVPAFTLAIVACVVAFGIVFLAATAVLRSLTDDPADPGPGVQVRAPGAQQGAMGALLSGRREAPQDPGRLK